jgi:hypothetical protein
VEAEARRPILAYLAGTPQVHQYNGYATEDGIRNLTWREIIQAKSDELGFDSHRFQEEAQALYDLRQANYSWIQPELFDRVFNRAMNHLGAAYRIEDGKVIVEDTSRLEAGLLREKQDFQSDVIE